MTFEAVVGKNATDVAIEVDRLDGLTGGDGRTSQKDERAEQREGKSRQGIPEHSRMASNHVYCIAHGQADYKK